ncbi:MAG: hypothetical protein K2O22_04320 [Anaeroplasmataceae bacterium]|nr:hypothetical protein [Anaeroplasmataceae bacterium]
MKSIKVVDKEGQDLSSLSIYQSNAEYKYTGVYVWAIFTDNSHKDVTKSTTFSEVDLSQVGPTVVTATYQKLTATYTLNVMENKVLDLKINTTNSKRLYTKNSLFDSTGLEVNGTFSDGSYRAVKNYTIKLSYNNRSWELNSPMTNLGTYEVEVSVDAAKISYDILVYDTLSESSYTLEANQLALDLPLDVNGNHIFNEDTTLVDTKDLTISVVDMKLATNDANGNPIKHLYQTKEYNAHLELSTKNGLEITVSEPTEVFLVVGNQYGATITFKGYGVKEKEAFGNINNYTSILYVSLEAGTYQLLSSNKGVVLYEMQFYFL